mmetsp:Transcript_9389/g.24187  ORF Transcript_9389/g.24187 Transcript_9389/m.24187 type:complete len:582 (-) Transcript_9389:117-1862(-)
MNSPVMADALTHPPNVCAAVEGRLKPMAADNQLAIEMVSELKRVMSSERDGTPILSNQIKWTSTKAVARNLKLDLGPHRILASGTSGLEERLIEAEKARAEAEETAATAWDRLSTAQHVHPGANAPESTASLFSHNQALMETVADQMLRIRSLERDLAAKTEQCAQLRDDHSIGEAVRESLESRVLQSETICNAVISVASVKEIEAAHSLERYAYVCKEKSELEHTVSNMTNQIDELSTANNDLIDECVALRQTNKNEKRRLQSKADAQVLALQDQVKELQGRLEGFNESLQLSNLESYRRKSTMVCTGMQTMPEQVVAKMQNSPYVDHRPELVVTADSPLVHTLKMWYMVHGSSTPMSRKEFRRQFGDGGDFMNVNKEVFTLATKALRMFVTDLRAANVLTFEDVLRPSARKLKSKAKKDSTANPKERVLSEIRAEVENLQSRGREWLSRIAEPLQSVSLSATSIPMPKTATAVAAAAAGNDPGPALTMRLSRWWRRLSNTPEEEREAVAEAFASRLCDSAMASAITFVTTRSKSVSFLTHDEAKALAVLRSRCAAERAHAKLRTTLEQESKLDQRSKTC